MPSSFRSRLARSAEILVGVPIDDDDHAILSPGETNVHALDVEHEFKARLPPHGSDKIVDDVVGLSTLGGIDGEDAGFREILAL